MVEDTDDIEFLDEDADIVQQCVQSVVNPTPSFNMETELLVERLPYEPKIYKRKRKINQDDSDYEPDLDRRRNRKRKQTHSNSYETEQYSPQSQNHRRQHSARLTTGKYQISKVKNEADPTQKDQLSSYVDLGERRKLDIRIPDYDDPLCLPVRAIIKEKRDPGKLNLWNNLCLEKFKQLDKPMRVDKDETISSKRTIVLRNEYNSSGKVDCILYSKIIVENKAGTKKTELTQSILPKYREKKLLTNLKLNKKPKKTPFHHKNVVILTQETSQDEESLVIYDPQEYLSMVYKMYDKDSDLSVGEEETKNYLKEVACCKMCAPCYQSSYRGYKCEDQNINCYICKKQCSNVANFISHLKTHSQAEIRKHKNILSKDLAKSINYQYKCRICQTEFLSVKELRKHVNSHKGNTPFKCEVGNHITQ